MKICVVLSLLSALVLSSQAYSTSRKVYTLDNIKRAFEVLKREGSLQDPPPSDGREEPYILSPDDKIKIDDGGIEGPPDEKPPSPSLEDLSKKVRFLFGMMRRDPMERLALSYIMKKCGGGRRPGGGERGPDGEDGEDGEDHEDEDDLEKRRMNRNSSFHGRRKPQQTRPENNDENEEEENGGMKDGNAVQDGRRRGRKGGMLEKFWKGVCKAVREMKGKRKGKGGEEPEDEEEEEMGGEEPEDGEKEGQGDGDKEGKSPPPKEEGDGEKPLEERGFDLDELDFW